MFLNTILEIPFPVYWQYACNNFSMECLLFLGKVSDIFWLFNFRIWELFCRILKKLTPTKSKSGWTQHVSLHFTVLYTLISQASLTMWIRISLLIWTQARSVCFSLRIDGTACSVLIYGITFIIYIIRRITKFFFLGPPFFKWTLLKDSKIVRRLCHLNRFSHSISTRHTEWKSFNIVLMKIV